MPNYFKTKIRFNQPMEEAQVGTRNEEFIRTQTKSEAYLIDAVSFTDAEARTFQAIAANHPEFEITHITREKLADLFRFDDGDDWYLGKVDFVIEDERTGKQKRIKSRIMVNAVSNEQANQRLTECLKSALDPFEITHVDKTDILEVHTYTANES